MVRIELFGIARVRAGTEAVCIEATTVREALLELARSQPALTPGIVSPTGELRAGYLLSRNGERFLSDGAQELKPGDILLLLSAQAGG